MAILADIFIIYFIGLSFTILTAVSAFAVIAYLDMRRFLKVLNANHEVPYV